MATPLNIITLTTRINNNVDNQLATRAALELFYSMYDVTHFNYDDYTESGGRDFTIVFIASGGTEEQFTKIANRLPKPIIVVSDSFHNSLAASMEITTWLKQKEIPCSHINIPSDFSHRFRESIKEELLFLEKAQSVYTSISNYRIALFGGESPWLISSGVDKDYLSNRYGISFIDFPVNLIVDRYNSLDESDFNSSDIVKLLNEKRVKNISEDAVRDAYKLYNVIKDICVAHSISALTIKCFDLISKCTTTACLALALLNKEGIIAGCEGDIPSLWSMILAKELCGQQSFMSNPSSIERIDNSVDFAHCTSPLNLGENYHLTTHYESGIGIGIRSEMKLGKYTLFKCGGEKLNKFFVFKGEVVQNTSVTERCRTQVKFMFKSESDLEKFLSSGLGNHTILIPGKYADIITRFLSLNNNT